MFSPISSLLFIAFLLLLLVSLSLPIIKPIHLFKLVLESTATVSFGVWGYCVSAIDVSVLGFNHHTAARCSNPHLGYSFDSTIATALHVTGYEDLISKSLTAALVLHPIACILTFLALLSSLFILTTSAVKRLSYLTFAVGVLAAFITTLAFFIDVILVAIVRHKVHHETRGDLTLEWGNAVWMTFSATLVILAAMARTFIVIHRNTKATNAPLMTF